MVRINRYLPTPLGIVLLLGLALSLACSPALAHDVDRSVSRESSVADTNGPADNGIPALIRAFRQSGDDRHLDEAWQRLAPMLDTDAPDAGVLIDAATVAQARHDFDAALEFIDTALLRRPNYDQAWLLRASIELVRGRVAEAQAACDRLHHVALLVVLTCDARVAIARGDHTIAAQRLSALLGVTDESTSDPEAIAWALSVTGDAASVTQPETAAAFYRQSLDLEESTQVRAALVDVLLSLQRPDQAAEVLEGGSDALPLDVRRFIVAKRTGRLESVADEVARADHEFRHWIADEDWAHAREMARFYIDVVERPALARMLVRINLDLQREPEDLLLAQRIGECSSCGR